MVLDFMRQFFIENDQLPPAHVIATKFGWASSNSASDVCECLARHGAIKRNAVGKYMFVNRDKAAAP